MRLGDLTYNVTDIRLLDRNKPAEAPYLVNNPPRPKGRAYLGVFLKIYNHNQKRDRPSAPGFLLEPLRDPSLVVMNQSSESPYRLDQGGVVPAGGELPIPGSPSAAGPIEGGLLLYVVSSKMTAVATLPADHQHRIEARRDHAAGGAEDLRRRHGPRLGTA